MMKNYIKKSLLFLSLLLTVILVACRSEDDLSIDPPAEANIEKNSTLAQLMARVALKDGSEDNIIDRASNLTVQLPVDVTVNDTEITVEDSDGYEVILDNITASDEDDDIVNISYPITVIFPQYTTAVVNSDEELNNIATNDDNDEDIECIDFVYPITVSVFIESTETFETISIDNDMELFDILDILDEFTAVTINFPITVILNNGSEEVVNSVEELEEAIATADDTCDEDDDNDFNDCNNNTFTPTIFEESILSCGTWTIDKLKRDNENLVDLYEEYIVVFNEDGTILVTENENTFNGTWEATGPEGNVDVTINVDGLPDLNDTWNLCHINLQPTEKKVELKLGTDRLRFGSTCEEDLDDSVLVEALTTGDWYVNYFFETSDDAADYIDYVFNFGTDNTATATDTSGAVDGTWTTSVGTDTDLALNLDFGTDAPLNRLAEGWDVLEVTDDIIRLQYSDGTGTDVFLNFGREPLEDNSCGTNTYTTTFFEESILGCDQWTIDKLRRNNNVLEDNYVDYTFSFNSDGTIVVTENANTFSGTWSASGTEGNVEVTVNVVGLPDFNDTWNLCQINLQATEKKIELKIGNDRLRFGSYCENEVIIDDTALVNSLTTGDWYVTYFLDNTDDTADFQDYTFNFATDNTATAVDTGGTVFGSWATMQGEYTELALSFDFGNGNPFGPMANEWDVLEVTNDIIRLKYVATNGSDRFLTFERTPFDGGGEEHPLVGILTDGTWYIPSFVENLVDLTLNLNGYEITFHTDGSLTATSLLQTLNGSWELLNDGNQLALDFGNANIFFANLNSVWDVLSYTNTEVVLQRENDSILGSGYDTLILEKL